ncbi:hypothetical protein Vqi01_47290 [Micromonospora qiuiae]|uniref:Uncharacterized protein n=1 Tax=Micromonospora qiuiae TaxID=502268 RepID=A0ABQ4JGE2_9ACTN|nr:hypothetical protein Vqi01_47290 [Micromonospora qiuiae]
MLACQVRLPTVQINAIPKLAVPAGGAKRWTREVARHDPFSQEVCELPEHGAIREVQQPCRAAMKGRSARGGQQGRPWDEFLYLPWRWPCGP